MTELDLAPAADRMAELVRGVPDGLLDGPTPCPQYRVADLVDHIAGLTVAFAAAASKDTSDVGGRGPSGDGSRLGADWRAHIALDLGVLTAAWRDPTAWTGMSEPGQAEQRQQIFGPLVAVADDAPMLDRVIGLSGRNPTWSP